MKRIVVLCIAIAFLMLALTGCGGKNPAGAADNKAIDPKETSTHYPQIIQATTVINGGITPFKGTPLGLMGELDEGEQKMNQLDAWLFYNGVWQEQLVDVTSKTRMDTKVAEVEERYLVHADTLDQSGRNFTGTAIDAGPGGLNAIPRWSVKVPFGKDYVHPESGLKFSSSLHGAWYWWDLYVEVNNYYDLTEYNSDLGAESRFRIIDGRYVVHISSISPKPRDFLMVDIWDFGEGAFASPEEHPTSSPEIPEDAQTIKVSVNKPTKLKLLRSTATISYREWSESGTNYWELTANVQGRTERLDFQEWTELDTCSVLIKTADGKSAELYVKPKKANGVAPNISSQEEDLELDPYLEEPGVENQDLPDYNQEVPYDPYEYLAPPIYEVALPGHLFSI